jgi:hypothetical protein
VEDALAQPEHVRHARTARAEEHDDALIDREFRRANDDAPEPSELSAGNPETQRRSKRALQVALDLQRHDGLDRAAVFGPLRVQRSDAATRNGDRVARQLTEIGRDENRRPRRDGQREHHAAQHECTHASNLCPIVVYVF